MKIKLPYGNTVEIQPTNRNENPTYYNTDNFSWKLVDEHGWDLSKDKLRSYEINKILEINEEFKNHMFILNVWNKDEEGFSPESVIIFVFKNNILSFMGINIKANSLKECDDFISKLLETNNWEAPKKRLTK